MATTTVTELAPAGREKPTVPEVRHPVTPTGPRSVETVKMNPDWGPWDGGVMVTDHAPPHPLPPGIGRVVVSLLLPEWDRL